MLGKNLLITLTRVDLRCKVTCKALNIITTIHDPYKENLSEGAGSSVPDSELSGRVVIWILWPSIYGKDYQSLSAQLLPQTVLPLFLRNGHRSASLEI